MNTSTDNLNTDKATSFKSRCMAREDIINNILISGDEVTYIVEGPTGWGKSWLRFDIAERAKALFKQEFRSMYFDCTTKLDQGDMMVPMPAAMLDKDNPDAAHCVVSAPHEEMGVHYNDGIPSIVMWDEYGKNPALLLPVTSAMNERRIGMREWAKGSIHFATTNKGTENLGDVMGAHQCNRTSRVVMAKPTPDEYLPVMINLGFHRSLMGFAYETAAIYEEYEDVAPDQNLYIMHPGAPERTQFVTGRSLHRASIIMQRHEKYPGMVSEKGLMLALEGTIGFKAAHDLRAHIALSDKAPKLSEIYADPKNAPIPDDFAALCLLIYNATAEVKRENISEWMTYLERLPREGQAMFIGRVMNKGMNEERQSTFFSNQKFGKWIVDNRHIYSTDV